MDEDVLEIEPPKNRMAIALLALIGALISLYLSLHKLGLIGSLLCGEGSCNLVQSTKWAAFMGVPVPFWGLAGYTVLTTLALAGLQPRFIDNRALRLALIVTAGGAFVFSLYLSALEMFVIHAWCRWCVASAIIATLIFLFTIPEMRRQESTT